MHRCKNFYFTSSNLQSFNSLFRHTSFYCALLYCTPQILHFFFFYMKARTSTSKKKIATSFTVIFVLLQWPGTEPAISLRHAHSDRIGSLHPANENIFSETPQSSQRCHSGLERANQSNHTLVSRTGVRRKVRAMFSS